MKTQRNKNGVALASYAERDRNKIFTIEPGGGKAHGTADLFVNKLPAEARIASLIQTAGNLLTNRSIAVLKQPSFRNMTSHTLG